MHPQPLKKKTATTTTSHVDRYRTKAKCNFIIFKLSGTPNDTTSIENRNKLWNKGSKGLATTTQLYTANDIFTTSKIPDY